MSTHESNITPYSQELIDLKKILAASIHAFESKKSTDVENEDLKETCSPIRDITNEEELIKKAPLLSEILDKIPPKENIKNVVQTTGIFSLANYIYDDRERAHLLPLLWSGVPIESSNYLYKRILLADENVVQEALNQYFHTFADKPKIVLAAITKCAPLIIAAHRKQIETAVCESPLIKNSSLLHRHIETLFKLPYIDIRQLRHRSFRPSSNTTNSKSSTLSPQLSYAIINEVDIFRSPNYSLIPYFEIELLLLKTVEPTNYIAALDFLNELVSEREYISPLYSNSIQTKRPVRCIKLMSFLAREVFNNMPPGEDKHLYNRSNIFGKGSSRDYSPSISLYTKDGEPLTRSHSEIYDAVCTLWTTGNEVITDLMIARAIWPNTSRHGSETFSSQELDSIRLLMNDLRHTYISIDATAELRKYKKIGKDDSWNVSDYAIPCTIVYQFINGGPYIHRAYKLMRTPILLAYSSALSQILTAPISIYEQNADHKERAPRTLRAAQVRSLILERLHHFNSSAFKKKEKLIPFERIYEAFEVRKKSGSNIEKKDRVAARKAAILALRTFKREELINGYEILKNGKEYLYVKVI